MAFHANTKLTDAPKRILALPMISPSRAKGPSKRIRDPHGRQVITWILRKPATRGTAEVISFRSDPIRRSSINVGGDIQSTEAATFNKLSSLNHATLFHSSAEV